MGRAAYDGLPADRTRPKPPLAGRGGRGRRSGGVCPGAEPSEGIIHTRKAGEGRADRRRGRGLGAHERKPVGLLDLGSISFPFPSFGVVRGGVRGKRAGVLGGSGIGRGGNSEARAGVHGGNDKRERSGRKARGIQRKFATRKEGGAGVLVLQSWALRSGWKRAFGSQPERRTPGPEGRYQGRLKRPQCPSWRGRSLWDESLPSIRAGDGTDGFEQ